VSTVPDDAIPAEGGARPSPGLLWFRIALGLAGLAVLGLIVRHVGTGMVIDTLRAALPWLPILLALDLFRVACSTAASYFAFGALARRIPRATLFRAHVLGYALGSVAPAPTVADEAIKAALLVPFVGPRAVTAVAFINQAATWISVGLFSVFCGLAIFALRGASIWFWACAIHAPVLVASGLALQAVTRSGAPGRWLLKTFPRLALRAPAFPEDAKEAGLWVARPTSALLLGRCFQVLQYGVAALAVGIHASFLGAMAAQGVSFVAAAVGVFVPAGVGVNEGAFTLAADMLDTTAVRATSIALLIRCNQLIWVLAGSGLALLSRSRAIQGEID
jgi:hypothetical protein